MTDETRYVEPENPTMERVAALAAVLHGMGIGCDWYEKSPHSQEPGPADADGNIWTVKITEAVMACKAPHDETAHHLVNALFDAVISDEVSNASATWDRAATPSEKALGEQREPPGEPR